MNILRNLIIKDLKLNKKRTLGTLIGIILSAALITVVGEGFYILHNTSLQAEINNSGYYHLRIKNINKDEIEKIKDNRTVKDVISINNIGYTNYSLTLEYSYVGDVYSLDEDTFDRLNYNIIEGQFPKSSNEILINRSFMYQNDLKVGDYFDLVLGDSVETSDDYRQTIKNTKTIKMKVSGVIDRFGDLITTNYNNDNYIAYVILKNPKNHMKDISSILGVENYKDDISKKYEEYDVNRAIILLEAFDFSGVTLSILLTFFCIVIFIIILASIFSIRNSFSISVSEKLKMYGMLRSVGATKKQIKKMVVFEGFTLGVIGIVFGILLGEVVALLLCFLINYLAESANLFNEGFEIFYKFSLVPILLSIIVGFVVIYGSIVPISIKASKTSPIKNIRNSDDIKNKKLKVPKIINKIFGFGGVISYKNLKRSKKKYRVTVVSLTSCIFIFIIASSFMGYALRTIKEEYLDLGYNISVNGNGEVKEEIKEKIINMNGAYASFGTNFAKENYAFKDFEHILNPVILFDNENDKFALVNITLYNENSLRKFAKENGFDYDYIKDKVIILNEVRDNAREREENKRRVYKKNTDYEVGDVLTFTNENGSTIDFVIGGLTRTCPIGNGCYSGNSNELSIIASYEHVPHKELMDIYNNGVFFDSDDPYELAKSIQELDKNIYIENLDEEANKIRTMILILSIIVYGFIVVVTFIGLSSVFNTINSNMELRSRDFATYKSIGMTKKEFNNMINLEAIFYSVKSLFYGIVLGIIGSIVVHKLIMKNYDFEYVLPINAIFIAVIFIVVIVLIIMKYSVSKINKQNIIETIRNNNI